MYWFSGFWKQHPMWYEDGTALFYALNMDQFARPWCRALMDYPVLLKWLSHATFYLEAFGPFLFFVPLNTAWSRPVGVVMFAGFHFGTLLMMGLGFLPWICWACLMLFLPRWVWDTVFKRGKQVRGWAPQQGAPSPSPQASQPPRGTSARTAGQAALGLSFVFVVAWSFQNKLNTEGTPAWLPPGGGFLVCTLRLEQKWAMFHTPEWNDGWYLLTATLANGRQVDLLTGAPPNEAKPENLLRVYPNYRWRKLTTRLWFSRYRWLRPRYASYLTKKWNAQHPQEEDQVQRVQLLYMLERTTDTGPLPAKKMVLYDSAE